MEVYTAGWHLVVPHVLAARVLAADANDRETRILFERRVLAAFRAVNARFSIRKCH